MSHKLAACFLSATLLGSLSGCSAGSSPPPPVDDTRGGSRMPAAPAAAPSTGMTTGHKVVLLAGAAALYYMYKHHQSASAATGEQGQYYLSKNGRVYYRDAEHRAHWITPPPEGVRVPEAEAAEYRGFQGYEGSAAGRDLSGISNED